MRGYTVSEVAAMIEEEYDAQEYKDIITNIGKALKMFKSSLKDINKRNDRQTLYWRWEYEIKYRHSLCILLRNSNSTLGLSSIKPLRLEIALLQDKNRTIYFSSSDSDGMSYEDAKELYKGLWKSYKKYIRIMKQSYIR